MTLLVDDEPPELLGLVELPEEVPAEVPAGFVVDELAVAVDSPAVPVAAPEAGSPAGLLPRGMDPSPPPLEPNELTPTSSSAEFRPPE